MGETNRPPTLVGLPKEILLLIFEAGPLSIADAIALRQTCQSLYQWSCSRLFWTTIIQSAIANGKTLPLPSFRLLKDLSVNELSSTCTDYLKSVTNLASPTPRYEKHFSVNLNTGDTFTMVSYIAFLPGGQFLMVLYLDGRLEVWKSDPRDPIATAEAPSSSRRSQAAGVRLAWIDTHVRNGCMDFETQGEAENTIDVGICTDDENQENTVVSAVRITIDLGFQAVIHLDLLYTSSLPSSHIQQFTVQKGLIVILWTKGLFLASLYLTVLDYQNNALALVDTTIESRDSTGWDPLISNSGDLFFYEYGQELTAFAYHDIRSLLPSSTRPGESRASYEQAPHSARVFGLQPAWTLPDDASYFVIHPWNTPNVRTRNLVPIITEALSGQQPRRLWIDAQLLDLEEVLRLLKDEKSQDLVLQRTCHDLGEVILCDFDGSQLLVTGTCGHNMVWIERPEGRAERTVTLLPLHASKDRPPITTSESPESVRRALAVPVDLYDVTFLDFCDEAATLALVTWSGSEQRIELFKY